MKTPFLASFIIFIIWLAYEISKSRRKEETIKENFWEKEARANNTRRKSLEELNYITIPFDFLPMSIMTENDKIKELHEILHSLSDSPIVNFSGISNTDLKLEYGAPNIVLLMRYDQNYTMLARTLNQWGSLLYEKGYMEEAKTVFEFAVNTDTDVSGTYKLLAQIYSSENNAEKIASLMEKAGQLKSGSKNIIVRILQEFYP